MATVAPTSGDGLWEREAVQLNAWDVGRRMKRTTNECHMIDDGILLNGEVSLRNGSFMALRLMVVD